MKARVRYQDKGQKMWVIEILSDGEWEFSKGYPVMPKDDHNDWVSDGVLCEIAHLQDIGYKVTVLN